MGWANSPDAIKFYERGLTSHTRIILNGGKHDTATLVQSLASLASCHIALGISDIALLNKGLAEIQKREKLLHFRRYDVQVHPSEHTDRR